MIAFVLIYPLCVFIFAKILCYLKKNNMLYRGSLVSTILIYGWFTLGLFPDRNGNLDQATIAKYPDYMPILVFVSAIIIILTVTKGLNKMEKIENQKSGKY